MLRDRLEKIATTDYFTASDVRFNRTNPFLRGSGDTKGFHSQEDFRSYLKTKVSDPTYGQNAQEQLTSMDNIAAQHKDRNFLRRVGFERGGPSDNFMVGDQHTRPQVVAESPNPKIRQHEIAHAIDFENRGLLTASPNTEYSPRMLTYNDKSLDQLRNISKRTAKKYPSEDPSRRAYSLYEKSYHRDILKNEIGANSRVLKASPDFMSKSPIRDLPANERKRLAEILAAQTSYFEGDPRSTYSKFKLPQTVASRGVDRMEKLDRISKMQGAMPRKWDDPFAPNYEKLKDSAKSRFKGRKQDLTKKIFEGGNPYIDGDVWKKMSKADRVDYIKQIKLNKSNLLKHLTPTLGAEGAERASKLYMREMMAGLRRTL